MQFNSFIGLILSIVSLLLTPGALAEPEICTQTELIISEAEHHGAGLGISYDKSEIYHDLVVIPPETVTITNFADFYDDYDNGKKRKIVITAYINSELKDEYSRVYTRIPFELRDVELTLNQYITENGGNPETLEVDTMYQLYELNGQQWDPIGQAITENMEASVVKLQPV